jgi:hypothetical protein
VKNTLRVINTFAVEDTTAMKPNQSQSEEQPTGPVIIPARVLAGLEAIRLDGSFNMLDRPGVQRRAYELEYYETGLWIEDNPGLYARAIFQGVEAKPSE